MDRIIDVADQPPSAHWVTAYALGLVASAEPTPELTDRVIEACGAHAEVICEARRELYRLEIFDEDLRRRAGQLLWGAAQAASEGVPTAAVGAG